MIALLRNAVLVAAGCAATVMAVTAQGPSGPSCDRGCLTGIVDQYMAALVAHDPARVSIAPTAKVTENTSSISVGEGLWIGASAAPTFRIYVPDPASGQVGFFGVLREFGRPVMLALRLKVEGRRLTEIEHVVARTLNENGLKNLEKPRPALLADVPQAERTPRTEMLRIGNSYYDSILQSSGTITPFADDCVRHENGMVTSGNRNPVPPAGAAAAPDSSPALARIAALTCAAAMDTRAFSYITGIDERRVTIADEQRGLVFGLSMFRHRGNVRTIRILNVPGVETIPMNFGPIDLQAAHMFKIHGGQLREIEAMGYMLPYKSGSGW